MKEQEVARLNNVRARADMRGLTPDNVPRHSLSQLSGIDRIFTIRSPQTIFAADYFRTTLRILLRIHSSDLNLFRIVSEGRRCNAFL